MNTVRSVSLIGAIAWVSFARGQTYTVFAAASLREAATQIAREFESTHPKIKVVLNFAGSQQLVAQIKQGAQADVLMSAGFEPLRSLNYKKESLRLFALNRLALVVPSSDRSPHSFKYLDRFSRLVLADKAVPVGHYSGLMLDKAQIRFGAAWRQRIEAHVASREQDVRAVLAKVELGEADAGIVYVTDVVAARSKVRVVPIPLEFNVEAQYPAVLVGAQGLDFLRFLFEDGSQRILAGAGFASPLSPVPPVVVSGMGKETRLDAAHLSQLKSVSFAAEDHGMVRQYRGFDLRSLLRRGKGTTILLEGADRYQVEADVKPSLEKGCYLVPMKDGNLQAVFPGQPARLWVHWLRRITIR